MRKIFLLLGLFLFLLGCDQAEIDDYFRWGPVSPEGDSLVVALERGYAAGISEDSLDVLAARLQRVAEENGNRQLEARSRFWNARLLNKRRHRAEAVEELKKAISLSDSAKYPYDQARFRHLDIILSPRSIAETHHILKQIEKFHSRRDDHVMLAHVYIDIANILHDIGDTNRALAYYMKADSLYNVLGMKEFHLKTSLNNASILHTMHCYDESGKIITRLLDDDTAKADFDYYNTVMFTASEILGSRPLLMNAYRELQGRPEYLSRGHHYEVALAESYLADGEIDSALIFIKKAIAGVDDVADETVRATMFRTAAEVYGASGERDSVAKYAPLYIVASDSVARLRSANEVYTVENRSEITKYEALAHSRRVTERLVWLIVIMGVAIVAMGVYMVLLRRFHRHRIEMARVQLDMERDRRQLVTSSLVMTEKDNVLQMILDDIGRLQKEGKIPVDESRQIDQAIRMHVSNKADWENLATSFEKVHPSFVRLLKERYPKLSEGDIKLAVYIKVGMSTKQIARMLLLQPDSVKKNRHRLRDRLGLEPEESLEDLLRNLG